MLPSMGRQIFQERDVISQPQCFLFLFLVGLGPWHSVQTDLDRSRMVAKRVNIHFITMFVHSNELLYEN
jgi:hypothetical protein